MTEEENRKFENIVFLLETHHIGTNVLFKMKNLIQEQQKELQNKDKIIDEMAKTIIDDSSKLDTFWCNGCFKIAECPYEGYKNNVKQCVIKYFEKEIENE